MTEKELEELTYYHERAKRDGASFNDWEHAAELAFRAVPDLLSDLGTLRRNYAQVSAALVREGERRIFAEGLLQEAKDALMAFLNDPAEAARARDVLRQLDEKLLPLASRRMPQ